VRGLIQPQLENALQLLETDLRGLWPQLQDTMESKFAAQSKASSQSDDPGFCAAAPRTLQSVQLALVERVGGKEMEEQLEQMFRETGLAPVARRLGCGRWYCHRHRSDEQRRGRRRDRHLAASAAVIGTFIGWTTAEDSGRISSANGIKTH
jgi:hypothetical protein